MNIDNTYLIFYKGKEYTTTITTTTTTKRMEKA